VGRIGFLIAWGIFTICGSNADELACSRVGVPAEIANAVPMDYETVVRQFQNVRREAFLHPHLITEDAKFTITHTVDGTIKVYRGSATKTLHANGSFTWSRRKWIPESFSALSWT